MMRSSTLRYSSSCGLKLGTAQKGYTKWLPLAFSSVDVNIESSSSGESTTDGAIFTPINPGDVTIVPAGSVVDSTRSAKGKEDEDVSPKSKTLSTWMKYLYVINYYRNQTTQSGYELEDGKNADVRVNSITVDDESADNVDSGYLTLVFLTKLFEQFDGVRTEEVITNPMEDPDEQYVFVHAMSKDKLIELRVSLPTNENKRIRKAIREESDLTILHVGKTPHGNTSSTSSGQLVHSGRSSSELRASLTDDKSYVRFIVYESPYEWSNTSRSRQSKADSESSSSPKPVARITVSPVVLCSPSFIKNFTFRVPPPPPTCAADDKEMWIMPNDWKIMTRIIDAEVNILIDFFNQQYSYMQWLPYLTTVGVQSDIVRAFLQESIDTFTGTDTTSILPVATSFRFPTSNPIMYPY